MTSTPASADNYPALRYSPDGDIAIVRNEANLAAYAGWAREPAAEHRALMERGQVMLGEALAQDLREFPLTMYGPGANSIVVHDRAEMQALGSAWSRTPRAEHRAAPDSIGASNKTRDPITERPMGDGGSSATFHVPKDRPLGGLSGTNPSGVAEILPAA